MADGISTYNHEGMELPFEDWSNKLHSFSDLASIIQTTHDAALSSAVRAINRMQTMRNWLIGYYIVEFEQCGKDRAEYGTQLLKNLEERVNRKGLTTTLFKWARKFYRLYPQMTDNLPIPICATVMHHLQSFKNKEDAIGASTMHHFVTPGKILELGKGFCFEARQKRIIIDDEYYYPDLVFYNRILHCGVIIELKNEEFLKEKNA